MRIEIRDHLILPFGKARKSDLQKIRLSSVAANGIYLSSDIPCLYINVAAKKPLTMQDYDIFIMGEHGPEPYEEDVITGLDFIHTLIQQSMPAETTTKYEVKFLALYFDYLKGFVSEEHHPLSNTPPMSLFNALLPIPQMQLYVHDPLEDDWSGTYEPSNNFRVDFGFWTGTKLIAVEIDGNEPEGYARDIRRDRLLRRAKVDVVHILNSEIDRHGENVIHHVLPESIRYEWRRTPVPEFSPFSPF
jgi:hypothetical protein